jgi:hypothetical protein
MAGQTPDNVGPDSGVNPGEAPVTVHAHMLKGELALFGWICG